MLGGKQPAVAAEKPQKPLTPAAIASLKAKIVKGLEKALKKTKFCYDRYGMSKTSTIVKYDFSAELRQWDGNHLFFDLITYSRVCESDFVFLYWTI